MDLREIGWGGGGVEWIHLAQDRDWWRAVVNTVMNLRVLAPRSLLVLANTKGKRIVFHKNDNNASLGSFTYGLFSVRSTLDLGICYFTTRFFISF
jgi:hypothetical protein